MSFKNKGGGSLTSYQKQQKGKSNQSSQKVQGQTERVIGKRENSDKLQLRLDGDKIDSKFGFDRFKEVCDCMNFNSIPISFN